MKRVQLKQFLVAKGFKIANCLALLVVVHSANVACGWIYHQAEEPTQIKQYRRF